MCNGQKAERSHRKISLGPSKEVANYSGLCPGYRSRDANIIISIIGV